ncbi:hypothetical protein Patl1_29148 [Pistacia atlantica]|uniref:Uncharacterized protein n=1 Tax=Pistacia atlantica TaxID=434234 RepID=A0ACC1BFJ9_9ROSI|nr:hypothetical protein Patl1_29148 [Pistacia atlantica]
MSHGGIFVTLGNLSYSLPNPNFILSDFFGPYLFGVPLSASVTSWTMKPAGTDGKLCQIFPRALAPEHPPLTVAPPLPVWDDHNKDEHSSAPTPRRRRRFDGTAAETRLQRMIRNRAASERTRIRRKAYDSQLMAEITFLREENKKLKQKEKELLEASEVARPLYQKIRRSFSAPF